MKTHSLGNRLTGVVARNFGTMRGWVRSLLGQLEFVMGRLACHTQPDFRHVDRLVFVCLGNINRSAFAEHLARKLGIITSSFGLSTATGAPAFHLAVETAPQFGVDLSGHAATSMLDYSIRSTDLLLVMEIRHAKRLIAAGVSPKSIALLGHWATPHRIHLHDPHTLSPDYFRTCFTLIQSAVQSLATELRMAQSPALPT